jgi:acetyltransferase-like isoleucine patch superfamily enzyme
MISSFMTKRFLARANIEINSPLNISRRSKLCIEENVSFKNLRITAGGRGEEPCHIGAFTFFMSGTVYTLTSIGRYCSIAPNVTIGAKGHPTNWLSTHVFQYYNKRIAGLPKESFPFSDAASPPVIGNDVWVGANATILRGVTVGDGAIIAAGAVVAKDVAPYEIVGGVPAKHIKYRFSEIEKAQLLSLKWWNYTPESLKGIEFNDIKKSVIELFRRKENGYRLKPGHPVE